MSRKDVLAALLLGASHQKINAAVGMLEDARAIGRTLDRIFCDPVKLAHDPEKWTPVFRKRSCSNKKIERDDDSKKSHLALVEIAHA